VETDSISVISTFQARKLLGETGGIHNAKQTTTWVCLIADECIGRNLVCTISLKSLQFCLHPAHTSTYTLHPFMTGICPNECKWPPRVLLVLNFLKEVQILNSLASNPNTRDVVKEHTPVSTLIISVTYTSQFTHSFYKSNWSYVSQYNRWATYKNALTLLSPLVVFQYHKLSILRSGKQKCILTYHSKQMGNIFFLWNLFLYNTYLALHTLQPFLWCIHT